MSEPIKHPHPPWQTVQCRKLASKADAELSFSRFRDRVRSTKRQDAHGTFGADVSAKTNEAAHTASLPIEKVLYVGCEGVKEATEEGKRHDVKRSRQPVSCGDWQPVSFRPCLQKTPPSLAFFYQTPQKTHAPVVPSNRKSSSSDKPLPKHARSLSSSRSIDLSMPVVALGHARVSGGSIGRLPMLLRPLWRGVRLACVSVVAVVAKCSREVLLRHAVRAVAPRLRCHAHVRRALQWLLHKVDWRRGRHRRWHATESLA